MDRSLSIWTPLAVFVLGSAMRASAQTEAQGLDLQWNAPAACVSSAAARAEISQLIRPGGGAGTRARVTIEGTPQTGYVAEIGIARGGSSGERTLRGARCSEVAEAAVLIVAMVIDPEAADRAAASDVDPSPRATAGPDATSQPAPGTPAAAQEQLARQRDAQREPATAQEAEAVQEAEAEPQPEPEESEPEEEFELDEPSDPRARGRFTLGVLAGVDAGSLPGLTTLGGLAIGVAWQRTRLELRAFAYAPQVEAAGPDPASNAEISLYSAALAGCVELAGARDAARAIGACSALEVGRSSGSPSGISDGQSQAGLWLAGVLGLDVRQQLTGPLHLRLHAEAGIPILRPSYAVEPFGRVFRASPVLARFGISAIVLFP